MTDPRAVVDFDEINPEFVTLKIDDSTITYSATETNGSSAVGQAVALSADATIELAGDGEEVLGKLIQVFSDNFATVQTGGYMTLPAGQGATVTLGKRIVGDLGAGSAEGYIREVDTAQAAELGVARGMVVDASDTDNVVVKL